MPHEYFSDRLQRCASVSKEILCALAIGLELDEAYFLDAHMENENQLRLLHYPRTPEAELKRGDKGMSTSNHPSTAQHVVAC